MFRPRIFEVRIVFVHLELYGGLTIVRDSALREPGRDVCVAQSHDLEVDTATSAVPRLLNIH